MAQGLWETCPTPQGYTGTMRSASRKEMYPVRIPTCRPARLSRSSISSLLIWSKHLYKSTALPHTHLRNMRASSIWTL
eukprot:4532557-Alexandrium_andersonii.AAC.1